MWAYRDTNRVGYDLVGANFYLEKLFGFDSDEEGQTSYYSYEIPDTFTIKEAKEIGEKARKLLITGYYSNDQRVVDMILEEYKNEQELFLFIFIYLIVLSMHILMNLYH